MSNSKENLNRSEVDSESCDRVSHDDIIQILVANDINLGYELTVKTDQLDDSFRTFEEILKYARDYDVDAILFGGNLFYETNPPTNVIMRCISLLRLYCLSQKAVKIDCITDPGWIFSHCPHKIVNFKDPNLNIGIPVFAIYGHRDTPTFEPVGSLDLLAATGLINYFGKCTDDAEISIPPLLLHKGVTTLALYGLNHMNDEKLTKLIKHNKFELMREDSIEDVCNVLVLHQNRARPDRTEKMFVSETLLPDFLNLVIWAHEPVCRIKHEPFPTKTFRITQPGSCIATSLTKGETITKHAGILQVYKDAFKMKYLKLKTVRPFVYDKININEHNQEIFELQHSIGAFGRAIFKSRKEAIEEFVDNYIKNILLPQAYEQETGHPNQPKKPLLRLKIFYDQAQDQFNTLRISKKYIDQIANPNDILILFNNSLVENNLDIDSDDDDYEDLSSIFFPDEKPGWTRTVEQGITEHFNQAENRRKLNVLTLDNLNKALVDFKNGDHKSFERTVRAEIQEAVNHLLSNSIELEELRQTIRSK